MSSGATEDSDGCATSAQGWREPIDLRLPVRDERRGDDEERRPVARQGGRALLECKQERQNLYGLAQAHVIGQARTQAQAVQEREPADAHLLVGPQLGSEPGDVRRAAAQCFGPAQGVECVLEPRAGHHLRPIGDLGGRGGLGAVGQGRAGEEAHTFDEGEPVPSRRRLDLFPVLERVPEAGSIRLDPLPPDQCETLRGREDLLDLRLAQRLPVQGHAHVEVEQRIGPDAGRRAGSEVDLDPRPRRPPSGPPVGHTHHHPRFLEDRNVFQEPVRLLGRQAERPIHIPGVDQLAQQLASRSRSLHGPEQCQEPWPVPGPRVLANRLAERSMARLAVAPQTRAVGGKEGERRVGLGPVLREMEMHAADEMPRGMPRSQKRLHRPVELGQLGAERRVHGLPE